MKYKFIGHVSYIIIFFGFTNIYKNYKYHFLIICKSFFNLKYVIYIIYLCEELNKFIRKSNKKHVFNIYKVFLNISIYNMFNTKSLKNIIDNLNLNIKYK